MATTCIAEANELDDRPEMTERFSHFYSEPEDFESAAILKKRAVECLERSLELAPDHLPTYRFLFDAHTQWNDQPALEAAARRLIERFPDDLETLQFLVTLCLKNDQLDDAISHLRKARRKNLSMSRLESTK